MANTGADGTIRVIVPGTLNTDIVMLSRTSRDPFGLWRPPVEALEAAGVNTDCVFVSDYAESGHFPGGRC